MDPIEVDPVDVVERPADSKGRISVGTDYAGETVVAAVIEVVGPEQGDKSESGDAEDAHPCDSCSDRAGTIAWRDSLWCPSCFEAEAKIRTGDEYWISRVLGTHDNGEFDAPLDAENIEGGPDK